MNKTEQEDLLKALREIRSVGYRSTGQYCTSTILRIINIAEKALLPFEKIK